MTRVLAIDPGAERLGWAIMDRDGSETPVVKTSGILGVKREDGEEFQKYKLRLIEYWSIKAPMLIGTWSPTILVSETQPAVGGGNFIAATQSELAKTAITCIQVFAYRSLLTVVQIASNSVKASIGGKKDATKAKVRNGVIALLNDPDLATTLKAESVGKPAVWDRSDAIANGLAYFGLSTLRNSQ